LLSPLNVFFSYFAPTVAANGQYYIFILNVDFDVAVVAFAIPWILAGFSHSRDHLSLSAAVFGTDLRPLIKHQVV